MVFDLALHDGIQIRAAEDKVPNILSKIAENTWLKYRQFHDIIAMYYEKVYTLIPPFKIGRKADSMTDQTYALMLKKRGVMNGTDCS